ncbi:aspartate beta-hydroxylase [Blastomonas aquatica]|uniref:Aspartate beta-hydroxylase n=2 Tax=Blastomonas aquatica TaxID=1510276 RepID=A0ABQ1J3N6_9SPHN|nr:aspartate beta-hydroxylase [Blastomonas aquatica]
MATRPDKRKLMAQVLLDGGTVHDLHARLVAEGVSDATARYEIDRAEKDPMFIAARRLANRVAKRDWTLDIYRKLDAARCPVVPVIDAIAPDQFFEEFYTANRPVKLTGLVDHWSAIKRWTLAYFAQALGDAQIELQGQRNAAADFEIAKDRHRRQVPFRDVLDLLANGAEGNDFYITAYNDTLNKQSLAPLWDDLGGVSLLTPSGGRDGFLWLGPKGTVTPFHHDLTNNLLVQVLGRKRVKLVPAYEVARMRNSLHCFSDWTGDDLPAGPSDERRPLVMECEIGPGEALFLPIGWWHHVVGLDMTCSMSFTNFSAPNDYYSDYLKDSVF